MICRVCAHVFIIEGLLQNLNGAVCCHFLPFLVIPLSGNAYTYIYVMQYECNVGVHNMLVYCVGAVLSAVRCVGGGGGEGGAVALFHLKGVSYFLYC